MIVEVWQYHDNPDHLVMCINVYNNYTGKDDTEVINGWYVLTDSMKEEFKAKYLGQIDWPWLNEYQQEEYDLTLERFKNGERAQYVTCTCCDVGSWRNEKGEKIKEPDPKDYPTNYGVET